MTDKINTYHIPVLRDACIEGLDIKPNGIYVDVTFGGGGHSLAAGIRMAGPLEDAREKVLVEIREAIKRVGIS